jgi:D-alanine transaminase
MSDAAQSDREDAQASREEARTSGETTRASSEQLTDNSAARHEDAIVYLNGAFIADHEARISPLDRGFLFADGVYEVLRFYSGIPFLLEEHLQRLDRSMAEIRLPNPRSATSSLRKLLVEPEELFAELIRRNGLEARDGLIYLQVTRGVAPRSHPFPRPTPAPTVYAFAEERSRRPQAQRRSGVSVITHPDERHERCDIKSTSLLPNILASQAAADAGAVEAILYRDGVVTEGSHSSLFGLRDGVLRTHPPTQAILPGITRELLLSLARRLEIPVEERALSVEELRSCDELFLAGTGSEIAPITMVDGESILPVGAGPTTLRLQQAFDEMIDRLRRGR